jgi:hypothetical protein
MSSRWKVFPVLALLAAFVTLISPSSVGAAPRSNVPSCSQIIPEGSLIRAMGVPAVLHFTGVSASIYSPWGDGPGGLRGANITHSSCSYDWEYSTPGSLPMGDPDPDTTNSQFVAPNVLVLVGAHVTAREWNYIKTNEARSPGGDTDACSGCAYAPQQPLALGAGTQAFIESFAVPAPVATPPSPDATCYMLYVLTEHHNLLEISVWPAPLEKEKALVAGVLGRFRQF